MFWQWRKTGSINNSRYTFPQQNNHIKVMVISYHVRDKMTKVIIVGAGVGGLTLALALHERGIVSQIYEAHDRVKTVGAGINLQAYAVKVLHQLGIAEELSNNAICPEESTYISAAGQTLFKEPLGHHGGSDFPQYSIHRYTLQKILCDAVQKRLGQHAVQFSTRVNAFSQDENGVTVQFEGGDTTDRADVLVGCDGVHSIICHQMYPDNSAVRLPGITMWRGVARNIPPFSRHRVLRAGRLESGKLIAYPIKDPDDDTAILWNWVAELHTGKKAKVEKTSVVAINTLPEVFNMLQLGELDGEQLIQNSSHALRLPMADRKPLPNWSIGKVTLLGDAAHPMYPVGSNGAGQAIIDAATLAECLQQQSVEEALQLYNTLRRPAVSKLVEGDRLGGPDVVLNEMHRIVGSLHVPEGMLPGLQTTFHEKISRYRKSVGILIT